MPAERRRVRDPWCDNAKFILVTLVVIGHSWALLPKPPTDVALYSFLYSWHMPAFVIITGYLSRSFVFDRPHVASLLRGVLAPYLLFEGLLGAVRMWVGGETLHALWLNPHWPMWYLCALFLWRLATPLLHRVPAALAIPAALAVSLSAGYWAVPDLDLLRVFGMLPFFVLGLKLKPQHLDVLRRPAVRELAAGVLATLLTLAFLNRGWLPTNWLYYSKPYADMHPAGGLSLLATRGLVLGIGLAAALSVLALVPRTRTWFTTLGAASLVVYLFHGFGILTAGYLGAGQWAARQDTFVALGVFTATAAALATLLSQPWLSARLSRLTDPYGLLRLAGRELVTPRQDYAEGPASSRSTSARSSTIAASSGVKFASGPPETLR